MKPPNHPVKLLAVVKGVGQTHVNYVMHLRMFLNISLEQIVSVQNINGKVRRG